MEALLGKINSLKNWQVALIIAVLGFVVFLTGLNNPFQGDDISQIVNNVPIHSISHVKDFFEGSTFYNGGGDATSLVGIYYRPLMLTTFSLLYTIFGAHPFYFHLLQLCLYISCAILLYLYLRYSFATVLALALALIFLVHPLNSQVAYAIPSMQDAEFFFFGVLAMWLLVRFHSVRSLLFVTGCLFLSLLSKESGALFVLMALLYLLWFDRRRLLPFVGIVALPIILYVALRVNAVGLNQSPNIAPVDNLSFSGRLLTMPSIMLFYLVKFIFPLKLATAYYWIRQSFSWQNVLLPVFIDISVLILCIYLGFVLRRRAPKAQYYTYLFFSTWVALGLLVYLQIFPLDMTACEAWFYFPMAGLLGMLGVVLVAFQKRVQPKWFLIVIAVILTLFALRAGARGLDYSSMYKLASHDIVSSKEDYSAANIMAIELSHQGAYDQAEAYSNLSIRIHPSYTNYNTLGNIEVRSGNYKLAEQSYIKAIDYFPTYESIVNLAAVRARYDNPTTSAQFDERALQIYPKDGRLWFSLAISYARLGDAAHARSAASQAQTYGYIQQPTFNDIMSGQPF